MAAKIRALQQWCKVQCDGYRDVSITNMTSSWKNGLAFCAIIHRFHPDLIDYESLSKENVFENNKLAFDTAESLGIAALLDPADMVAMPVPDKLCIVTYVSQYYNHLSRCQPVGGPGVSVAVKRSANNTAHDVIKRPALESVKRNTVQESAGSKRNTWQDQCCVCHKKVYLMERHMNNNQVYHRQCFRHHERASCVADNKVSLQSCDDAADMSHDVVNGAASAYASASSDLKYSHMPSPSLATKIDHMLPETSSSPSKIGCTLPDTSSTVSEYRMPSCESSAGHEQASVKPSSDQQQNKTVRESNSQINDAAVDISAQETSASAHWRTDLSVVHHNEEVISEPAAAAGTVIALQTGNAVSVRDSVSAEELVLSSSCSMEDSTSQVKSAVNDASEVAELQNKVESETSKKDELEKPAKTSVSDSLLLSSVLRSAAAAKRAEQAESASSAKVTSKMTVSLPQSLRPAPVTAGVTAQQRPPHSPNINVCETVSSDSSQQPAVKLPSGTVSSSDCDVSHTTHNAASATVAQLPSESSATTVHHTVKNSHRIIPRRLAPVPPGDTHQKTTSSEQPIPVTLSHPGQAAVNNSTAAERSESSYDTTRVDKCVTSRQDFHIEQQSSTEAANKQTAAALGPDQPVPAPRHDQLPKLEVPSADVEMHQASVLSSELPEGRAVIKDASDNTAVALRASPVPRPRKNLPSMPESVEMAGKEKPNAEITHANEDQSRADRSLAAKSQANDSAVTDSHISAASGNKPEKQMPATFPKSPEIDNVSSSSVPCKESKSPSLPPALPVNCPRSKKRTAAPPPPRPPAPVSPRLPSPKPEEISATKPEPQTLGLVEQPGPQAANKTVEKSADVNSEQSSTANAEPVRKKITPAVKFTFEKDVFRPPNSASMGDPSPSEQLKPSRPAPPRPTTVSVTKRKIAAEEQLPVDDIKQRLVVLDAELKKLEQEGCQMEDRIRSMPDDDDDDMMSDWLDMVHKKNELVREESELIYRLRQQQLEDRHSQVEYQLRCLMAIPEHKKTEAQRSREAKLLKQLLVTVRRRNNIIDSMEEDRKRYLEEDEQISQMKATQGIDRKKKAG